jgi:hypothetical protein
MPARRKIYTIMIDLSQVDHHPAIEELVDVLCNQTQNNDRAFFRVTTAYFLSVIASTMRAKLMTEDRGEIVVNSYTLALSPSGTGKGYSVNILENEFLKDFRTTFVDHTLPILADMNMWVIASQRAAQNGTEEQHEYDRLSADYTKKGEYPFVFDGASEPAIKQVREKLLIAGAGSINLQIDEIGLNIESSTEALTAYLELYDKGFIKNKLTKNSSDNVRTKEIIGSTPANLLMFGTPSMLLDGSSTEDKFYSLLETGYARRSLFAMGCEVPASDDMTAAEIYEKLISKSDVVSKNKWTTHFANLADPSKFGWITDVPKDVAVELLQYRIDCEEKARLLPSHEGIQKAEMSHRYFKAIKLAGVFAFIDESMQLTMYQLHAAIKLVEDSGNAFQGILTREKPYMKLANYLTEVTDPVTHADLVEALPFYKNGKATRDELMRMATSWSYKQHIVIKTTFADNVELFIGESLEETSLDSVKIAYSDDFAFNYAPESVPFGELHKLALAPNQHWTNHQFNKQHRFDENVIPGFNLVVIDVDGGVKLDTVHDLLADHVYMTYTTKRHTNEEHRFRLILPTNYELKLDKEDYRKFMNNFMQWLPFPTDEAANQRSKKWMSNSNGLHHVNLDGKLLDILPFVPKTSRNEQFSKENSQLKSLDNLERWFANVMSDGNRNNHMIKFALALVSSGMGYEEIEAKVLSFNKKLSDSLPEDELRRTVLVTVARKLQGTP